MEENNGNKLPLYIGILVLILLVIWALYALNGRRSGPPDGSDLTEEEQAGILEQLKDSSGEGPDEATRNEILESLRDESSADEGEVTEEERNRILEQLQNG